MLHDSINHVQDSLDIALGSGDGLSGEWQWILLMIRITIVVQSVLKAALSLGQSELRVLFRLLGGSFVESWTLTCSIGRR